MISCCVATAAHRTGMHTRCATNSYTRTDAHDCDLGASCCMSSVELHHKLVKQTSDAASIEKREAPRMIVVVSRGYVEVHQVHCDSHILSRHRLRVVVVRTRRAAHSRSIMHHLFDVTAPVTRIRSRCDGVDRRLRTPSMSPGRSFQTLTSVPAGSSVPAAPEFHDRYSPVHARQNLR